VKRDAILKAAMEAGCDEAERLGYGSELGYVEAASIGEKAATVALEDIERLKRHVGHAPISVEASAIDAALKIIEANRASDGNLQMGRAKASQVIELLRAAIGAQSSGDRRITTSRSAAQGVTCPRCGAAPGQPCTGARGKVRESMHRERHQAIGGGQYVPADQLAEAEEDRVKLFAWIHEISGHFVDPAGACRSCAILASHLELSGGASAQSDAQSQTEGQA
jgi:hypothetical protein